MKERIEITSSDYMSYTEVETVDERSRRQPVSTHGKRYRSPNVSDVEKRKRCRAKGNEEEKGGKISGILPGKKRPPTPPPPPPAYFGDDIRIDRTEIPAIRTGRQPEEMEDKMILLLEPRYGEEKFGRERLQRELSRILTAHQTTPMMVPKIESIGLRYCTGA